MTKRFINLLFFLLIASLGWTQAIEVSPPDFIKTIQFKANTTQGQLPILRLGETFRIGI
jgi:hypothetical protein